MSIAVYVSLAVFVAGVIYASGRLSARVDAIEAWRSEVKSELVGIRDEAKQTGRAVGRIESMLIARGFPPHGDMSE